MVDACIMIDIALWDDNLSVVDRDRHLWFINLRTEPYIIVDPESSIIALYTDMIYLDLTILLKNQTNSHRWPSNRFPSYDEERAKIAKTEKDVRFQTQQKIPVETNAW
jgi:hypothetical protein